MTLVVTGGDGQLGRALVAAAGDAIGMDRAQLDVCDGDAVARVLDAVKPRAVAYAAAYTSVDRAEVEEDRAFAVNAVGAGLVARACEARGVAMVYVSTDQVFDGRSSSAHREGDPRAPVNAYGRSKAAGEDLVRAAGGLIIRTSWVFAARGHGFVQAIVAAARTERVLRVVGDQRGCPTFVDDLAVALLALLDRPVLAGGVLHWCGDGAVTRHAFAQAIVDEARRHGAIACERIDEIATEASAGVAPRPPVVVLETSRARSLGLAPGSWRPGLARAVAAEMAR